jgi:Plasmid pRiA4b ORF-3-like protein
MDGERACPPEDCGGNFFYARILSILANPSHPEYQATLAQCHDSKNYSHLLRNQQVFDPAKFDLVLAQERVRLCFLNSASKQRKYGSNEMKASCSCSLCVRQRRESTGEQDESQQQEPSLQLAFMNMASMGSMGSAAARRQTQNLAMGKTEFFGKNDDGNRCCSFCLDREYPYAAQRFQKCIKCQQVFIIVPYLEGHVNTFSLVLLVSVDNIAISKNDAF